MDKESKINVISLIIIVGFVLSVFYHYILGTYLNLNYPFNTFLFIPGDKFMDFFNVYNLSKDLNPYCQTFMYVNYFPFAYFVIYLFTLISAKISFLFMIIAFILFFVYFNYKNLKFQCPSFNKITLIKYVFIFSFMTYPFLLAIDRANFELVLFIFLALFTYFYVKKDFSKSIIFLSFAIAMKLYPITLLVLFFSDKKYKEIFYTLLLTLFISLISLVILKGSAFSNIICLLKWMTTVVMDYAIGNWGLGYSSSLYGILKLLIFKMHSVITINTISGILPVIVFKLENSLDVNVLIKAYKIYSIVVIALFSLIAAYVAFVEKQLWKKIALLLLSAILFTPISGDYKLLHLFIPLWLFWDSKDLSKFDMFYAVSFGLLLIPKDYLYIYILGELYNINILLNPIIMTLMVFVIIWQGITNRNKQVLEVN